MTLNNLGVLNSDTQRLNKADEAYGEALPIYIKLAEANPGTYLPRVAMTMNNLAMLYHATERFEAAEAWASDAVVLLEEYWQQNPEVHRDLMAKLLQTGAVVAKARGNRAQACSLARRGLAAAYDAALQKNLHELIDRVCSAPMD